MGEDGGIPLFRQSKYRNHMPWRQRLAVFLTLCKPSLGGFGADVCSRSELSVSSTKDDDMGQEWALGRPDGGILRQRSRWPVWLRLGGRGWTAPGHTCTGSRQLSTTFFVCPAPEPDD